MSFNYLLLFVMSMVFHLESNHWLGIPKMWCHVLQFLKNILSFFIIFLSICVKQYPAMHLYKMIFYIRKEKNVKGKYVLGWIQ